MGWTGSVTSISGWIRGVNSEDQKNTKGQTGWMSADMVPLSQAVRRASGPQPSVPSQPARRSRFSTLMRSRKTAGKSTGSPSSVTSAELKPRWIDGIEIGAPRVLVVRRYWAGGAVQIRGSAALDHYAHCINVSVVGTFNMLRLVAHKMGQTDALDDDSERGRS